MCHRTYADNGWDRRGIVLLITLVILVILSTLAYTLSARVAARRHRNSYLVDYTQAQYACSSAMKYALVSLNNLDAKLISRPNEPDFSDVFAMSDSDYQAMLARFAKDAKGGPNDTRPAIAKKGAAKPNNSNDANDATAGAGSAEAGLTVPGPYGPPWPLVASPWQIEIASAKVTIEIEDESAKYPLGWALIMDEKLKAQANASFATFCEWMRYNAQEIDSLKEALVKINAVRPFKMAFSPLSVAMPVPVTVRSRPAPTPTPSPAPARGATPARGAAQARSSSSTSTPSSTPTPTPAPNTSGVVQRPPPRRAVSVADQAIQQSADMARLFHGGMIDTDLLSRPSVVSDSRQESAMKYLGLWGTRQVNVNTAPRQVLDAALMFGSIADAPKMADAIIAQRRIKPFDNIDELKKILFRYSDSIDKCRDFLTTTSTVFTVRVTAVSGVAKVVAVAGVIKEGRQVKRIAVISD